LSPLLIAIAYLTYAERKVLAFSQLRKGRTWSDRSLRNLPTGSSCSERDYRPERREQWCSSSRRW
jgi:hypothetical protein